MATHVCSMMSGEELYIFYGSALWFEDHASGAIGAAVQSSEDEPTDRPTAFLSSLQL